MSDIVFGLRKTFRASLVLLLFFTLLCGMAYPLFVTALAQLSFPTASSGSLIIRAEAVVGSALIAQPFSETKYFWGRPSATSPANNSAASAASNLSPEHPDYIKAVTERVKALKASDPAHHTLVPIDLVTTSGSGLDPHITMSAARFQAARVAKARNMSEKDMQAFIDKHAEGKQFGVLGEPRVNVLKLNLALDSK